MSSYVYAPNGVVATYPYSYALLRSAHPDVSFPAAPGDWLAEYDVFPVAPAVRPPDTATTNFVEGTPALVGGAWRQVWSEIPASAGEIAERAEIAAQAGELDAAKVDAWVVQFLGMTPSAAQDFVNANGATLAAVRTNVARLAYVVRVLVRREFNR